VNKVILNYEVTGCPNHCQHCYCYELKAKRELIDIEDVVNLSKSFQEKSGYDTSVYLLQEQTYHPEFASLIKRLKEAELTLKNGKGMLVTNGFGLAYNKDLVKELSSFYRVVKFTLFGTNEIHDSFVNRKGHFNEIVKASKLCLEHGIDVVWQIMLTKGHTDDVSSLLQEAKTLNVNAFVSGNFFYSGGVLKTDEFVPTEDDIKSATFEIYEKENDLYFPESKAHELKDQILEKTIDKVSLDNLYIDTNFDVYPLNCIEPYYKLGNIKENLDELVMMLKDHSKLPPSIKARIEADFDSLITTYINLESNQMHTAQTLFEKLIFRQVISVNI